MKVTRITMISGKMTSPVSRVPVVLFPRLAWRHIRYSNYWWAKDKNENKTDKSKSGLGEFTSKSETWRKKVASLLLGGSRAGGIVAACWAALLYFGRLFRLKRLTKFFLNFAFCQKFHFDISGVFEQFFPQGGLCERNPWYCDHDSQDCRRHKSYPWCCRHRSEKFFFSVFFSRSMTFFYICVSSYDKVSDVVESWVRFAGKTLTPRRMH